jgi:hypothetical protein
MRISKSSRYVCTDARWQRTLPKGLGSTQQAGWPTMNDRLTSGDDDGDGLACSIKQTNKTLQMFTPASVNARQRSVVV